MNLAGMHMRLRGPFLAIGALGLAVLTDGLVAVSASIGRAEAIRQAMLGTTITGNSVVTFAAPPSDAMPALTPEQALRQSEPSPGSRVNSIPAGVTVKLGLLSLLVGPYCGAECSGLIVRNGLAYQELNQLAYGYSRPSMCPGGNPSIRCRAGLPAAPAVDSRSCRRRPLACGAVPERVSPGSARIDPALLRTGPPPPLSAWFHTGAAALGLYALAAHPGVVEEAPARHA